MIAGEIRYRPRTEGLLPASSITSAYNTKLWVRALNQYRERSRADSSRVTVEGIRRGTDSIERLLKSRSWCAGHLDRNQQE